MSNPINTTLDQACTNTRTHLQPMKGSLQRVSWRLLWVILQAGVVCTKERVLVSKRFCLLSCNQPPPRAPLLTPSCPNTAKDHNRENSRKVLGLARQCFRCFGEDGSAAHVLSIYVWF